VKAVATRVMASATQPPAPKKFLLLQYDYGARAL
jgi:hypothetical protein